MKVLYTENLCLQVVMNDIQNSIQGTCHWSGTAEWLHSEYENLPFPEDDDKMLEWFFEQGGELFECVECGWWDDVPDGYNEDGDLCWQCAEEHRDADE